MYTKTGSGSYRYGERYHTDVVNISVKIHDYFSKKETADEGIQETPKKRVSSFWFPHSYFGCLVPSFSTTVYVTGPVRGRYEVMMPL